MPNVNKVILMGVLGRDPETKTFPNGGSITIFSMATTEQWKDQNGVDEEVTEIRGMYCSCFNEVATYKLI